MLVLRASRHGAAAFALALIAAAPACSSTPASSLAQPPDYDPKGEAKCGVTKSQAEPLIVEWPSAARGKLETQARRGLVAVRYSGCEMEVLTGCRGPGEYKYAPMTRKRDRVSIRNEDDLYASIPVYAAAFEGKLKSAGELNVQMTLVGRYEAFRGAVRRDELQGECKDATHVITALTAGAFKFFAGADAEAGGGASVAGAGVGARSAAQRELLREDGDDASCQKATRADQEPPEGCGALLRVEVIPVRDEKGSGAVDPSPPHVEGGPEPVPEPAARPEPQPAPPPVPERVTEGLLTVTGKLSHADVQRVIRPALTSALDCYDAGRKKNPTLAGRVIVNLTIGKAGEVTDSTSSGSTLPDAGVQRCVLKHMQPLSFPAPEGGSAKVVYPIVFTPPAASSSDSVKGRSRD